MPSAMVQLRTWLRPQDFSLDVLSKPVGDSHHRNWASWAGRGFFALTVVISYLEVT